MKRSDIFRWVIVLLILAFGFLSHEPNTSELWLALAVMLYGLPVIAQLVPRTLVQVYGIFFGLFLVIQAVLSPFVAPDTYIVRQPNFSRVMDVVGDNLHGINGLQRLTTDSLGYRELRSKRLRGIGAGEGNRTPVISLGS